LLFYYKEEDIDILFQKLAPKRSKPQE